MRYLLPVALFTIATIIPASALPRPYVRDLVSQISVTKGNSTTTTTDTTYCIYFGNQGSEKSDDSGVIDDLMFLRPAKEVAEKMAPARKRWYAVMANASSNLTIVEALLEREVWARMPASMKNILVGLGIDDEDLVLILLNVRSGSIKVYFHPRHDHDKAFYEQKRQRIQSYLDGHDADQDIPFDEVVRDEMISQVKARLQSPCSPSPVVFNDSILSFDRFE